MLATFLGVTLQINAFHNIYSEKLTKLIKIISFDATNVNFLIKINSRGRFHCIFVLQVSCLAVIRSLYFAKPRGIIFSKIIFICAFFLGFAVAVHAQTIEYNQHGRRITYPNGEILFLGKAGDAIFILSNGQREYGSWSQSPTGSTAYLSRRTLRIPNQTSNSNLSGYCILRGQPVPDNFCY